MRWYKANKQLFKSKRNQYLLSYTFMIGKDLNFISIHSPLENSDNLNRTKRNFNYKRIYLQRDRGVAH